METSVFVPTREWAEMIRVDQCRACQSGPDSCDRAEYPDETSTRCISFRSKLKPHSHLAGYVAERRNPYTGDWNVLWDAREAYIDDADGRWACTCEKHGTIVNCTSQKAARSHLATADWCEECMGIAAAGEGE